jgi:hypothetical protein
LNAARCIVVCQARPSAKRISTPRYAGLAHEWAQAIGRRREDYGTHSLRQTKTIIYKPSGDIRAVRLPLGHIRMESTVRHLGINVEDVLNPRRANGVCKPGGLGRTTLGRTRFKLAV